MRASRNCLAFVGALLAMAPVALPSQPIYRCGNTYSQTPCENGIVVRADDKRTPDQKAQTDAATRQAAQLAERMEHDRLASEDRSAHATNRHAKGGPGKPPTSTPAAARRTSPEAKSRSRSRAQAADPFTATARRDDKKQAATAPARD